jgi:hypothetical protein
VRTATADGISFLLGEADKCVDQYIERIAGAVHDLKGIRPSEGFFIFALLSGSPPRRILESGRARGYSTDILARCFPGTEIISIELERTSIDVEIAEERLSGRENIHCKFGDARIELPRLIEPGDVVVIDGPKDFRALKLALRLLRTGHARGVFIHDLERENPVRRFLERRIPSTILSDNPEFLSRYGFVGTGEPRPAPGGRLPANVVDRLLQGAMGFIPGERRDYDRLLADATLLQFKERLRDTLRKLLRPFDRRRAGAE